MSGTQRSILISTQLRQIAEQAIAHPDRVFTSLIHRMDFDFLREAFYELRRDGAPGLSGITVRDYEKDLEANLKDLHERLTERTYVAPPIKRVWIDKDNGKKRPIGLTEIEDKIVQKAVSMLMGAVFEQDFLPSSYGFREGRNAHDALAYLREQCMTHGIRWIYDADITGFFDNLDWSWLREFIQRRINDGGVLRLIGKWLNAGIMEGEEISYSEKGTPQGGVISPMLANIYLHYALDVWFEETVKAHCKGQAYLCRYADDFVCAFECESDAERFYRALGARMASFGLEVAEEKTNLLRFSRQDWRRSGTFEFLGFEFRWGRGRWGKPVLKRRTARKKYRAALASFQDWCREHCRMPKKKLFAALNAKLRGYYNYYGIRGNSESIGDFFYQVTRMLYRQLNRRSQRRSYNWKGFAELIKAFKLARPHICHNF